MLSKYIYKQPHSGIRVQKEIADEDKHKVFAYAYQQNRATYIIHRYHKNLKP